MARPPRPESFDCRDCGSTVRSVDVPVNFGRRCRACFNFKHAKIQRAAMATPGGRERAREANRKNYERVRNGIPPHKDRMTNEAKRARSSAASRNWFKNNVALRRAARRKWNRTERGRLSALLRSHVRRARIKATATLTVDEWTDILRRSGGLCFYCRERRRLTMDHVTPIALGGAHAAWNIVAACWPCNSSKGAKRYLLL